MLDTIGWIVYCVADPKKSYIVGASDAANEAFRSGLPEKSQRLESVCPPHIFEEGYCDSYKVTGIREIDATCENYNDILKIKGMPASCMSDQNGREVLDQIQGIMKDYYAKNLDREALMSKVKDICKDMRVYQAQCRHTTGKNKEDNLQILREIYEAFQKTNVRQAVSACFDEGEKLAQANGGTERDNWVYYDADYYYESEQIRDCLREAIGEMAQQWETDVPDFDKIEENTAYTLDGKMDFNSCWDWAAMQRGNCSMKGYDEVPPKDFSFFYQESKYADPKNLSGLEGQKGVVEMMYQDKSWKADVPFNNSSVYGKIKEIFNAKNIFLSNYYENEFDSDLLSFLSKFDVFTRSYGSGKMIL